MQFITLDNIRGLPNEDSLFYLFEDHEITETTKDFKKELNEECMKYPVAPPKERLTLIKAQTALDEAFSQLKIWTDEIKELSEKTKYNREIMMRNNNEPKYGNPKRTSVYNEKFDSEMYCARCLVERYCSLVEEDKVICKGCPALICCWCDEKVIVKDKGYCWFCQYEFKYDIKVKPKVVRVKGKKKKAVNN